jgi:predicted RNA-binding Zn-ribbon protein involved in translation (DUF1610 family)
MAESQEQVFQDYRSKKRRLNVYFFVFVPALVGIFAIMATPWGKNHIGVCVGLLFALAVPSAIIGNMIWTCPACRKMLRKNWRPKFCPSCGVQLEPDAKRMELPQPEN